MMATRSHYPAPPCPVCGGTSTVKNTHYTPQSEILRNRKCTDCGHYWWTLQEVEINLDPAEYQVVRPKQREVKHKDAKLIKVQHSTTEL